MFIFKEKETSSHLFMVRYLSGRVVLPFFKKFSKGLLGVGIFLGSDKPVFVKKLIELFTYLCLQSNTLIINIKSAWTF